MHQVSTLAAAAHLPRGLPSGAFWGYRADDVQLSSALLLCSTNPTLVPLLTNSETSATLKHAKVGGTCDPAISVFSSFTSGQDHADHDC